ncbi:ABC transporter permease [Natrialbaceae archaeon A-CW2]|uniref:ABC transporter permease n=1 Tax=Natronosalvus amylolyticus TaxID=2961994 RepID=UPI0020CA218E|nr:ABC transporter permease [Natronosalvus amylolyticus]
MSVADYTAKRSVRLGGLALIALIALAGIAVLLFDIPLDRIFTVGFVNRTLVGASPIALAAIGGLYAEKSGVFNIGLEGFMIFGAITAAAVMYGMGGTSPSQPHIWLSIAIAVAFTLALTVLYAVLLIRYKADQIVAGLAIWFMGLGFAPFAASLLWDTVRSPGLASINNYAVPYLQDIPYIGTIVFNQSPLVLFTVIVVVVSWVFLYRTQYGYWIQAAGDNPKALDTAGVDVNRVRYATVIFSGAMAGLGGAVLLAHAGDFVGTGETMVDGRGWIAIVAYLFGNYNPLGAAGAALLFSGLDMLQVQFQTTDITFFGRDISARLIGLAPYIGVIIVLTVWGKTRMPSSVGEPYEKEE